jgi:hypothetical protein
MYEDHWSTFEREFREPGKRLLKGLSQFKRCVLVSGCQRSGTTLLTKVLSSGQTFTREHQASLILAGALPYKGNSKCPVLQSTYVNEAWNEYLEHDNFKLVWVIRDPFRTIYSMMFNWNLDSIHRFLRYSGYRKDEGNILESCCTIYNIKAMQLMHLKRELGDRVIPVRYESVVNNKEVIVPKLYEKTGLKFNKGALNIVRNKHANRWKSLDDIEIIEKRTNHYYDSMLTLL